MPTGSVRSGFALACAAVVWLGATALAAQTQSQDHAGQYAMPDIVFGAQLYAAQYVTCHGAGGDG